MAYRHKEPIMARKSQGAIRSTLRSVAKAATVIEIAMDIAIVNLTLTLEEEQHEADLIRAELAIAKATPTE